MSTTLNVIITDAGIAEVVNAEHDGTAPVQLTQVGFGRGIYTPTADQTELQDEIKRVDTIAGGVVGDNIMHIEASDGTAGASYAVYEIGVYTQSGTLFAVYSQPLPILHKIADSEIMCVIDFVLAGFEPTSVTVGDTNYSLAPATTSNQGVVELATNEEAIAGTDAERALTPASGAAAMDAKITTHAATIATSGNPGHFSFTSTSTNTHPFAVTTAGEHILNAIYMRNNYVTMNDAQTIAVPKTFVGDVAVLKLLSMQSATLLTGTVTGSSRANAAKLLRTIDSSLSLASATAIYDTVHDGQIYIFSVSVSAAQRTELAQYFVVEAPDGGQIGTDEAPFADAYIKNLNFVEGLYFNDTGSEIVAGDGDVWGVGNLLVAIDGMRNGELGLVNLGGDTQYAYIAEAATQAAAQDDSSTGVSCPKGSIAFVFLAKSIKASGVSVEIGETFTISATSASIAELTSTGFSTGSRYLPAGTYKAFCKITFTGENAFFTQPIFVQRVA